MRWVQNNDLFFTDSHSIYIHNDDYGILKTKGLTGKDLYQSKNDYGRGGIVYGLFLKPKIKYGIVIDKNGMLSQKSNIFQRISSKNDGIEYSKKILI